MRALVCLLVLALVGCTIAVERSVTITPGLPASAASAP